MKAGLVDSKLEEAGLGARLMTSKAGLSYIPLCPFQIP